MSVTSFPAVRGIEKFGPAELRALADVCDRLGWDEAHGDALCALISHESGFNPQQRNYGNPDHGAVGLIQFMPATAKQLGAGATSEQARANILAMTAIAQLEYVEKYFRPIKGLAARDFPIAGAGWPLGKPDETPGAVEGSAAYAQNKGLDKDNDGVITYGEVRDDVLGQLVTAASKPRVMVPPRGTDGPGPKKTTGVAGGAVSIVAALVLAWLAWKASR